MLGLTGVPPAAAIEPTEGPYEGKTEQGYSVSFEVDGRAVYDLSFTVKWRDCGVSPVHSSGQSAVIDANGHFVDNQGQWRFEGTFTSPTEVQGTATFLEHPLAGCGETATPYTASLRTGPPPLIPPCQSSQLDIGLHALYPGAGHHYLLLPLINRSSACSIRGFPWLLLRGAGKQPLTSRTVKEGQAHRVVLEPDEAVISRVRWSAAPKPGEAVERSCKPVPRSVVVHLPNSITRSFRWRWGRVCQRGRLRVSAIG
jgi:predicted heme/steroid binding protein